MDNDFKIDYNKSKSGIFRNINIILILIYTLFAIIMPADSFNIKKISFVLLFILNFNLIFVIQFRRAFNIIGFHIFIFPLVLFIFSIIREGNIYETISNIYICLYASLIIIIEYRKIDFQKMLFFALTLISIIMICSVLLDAFNILDIYSNNLMMFLHNNSEAMVGKSPIYWSYYIVFLKASPLIIILLGYGLFKRRYLLAALAFIAMFISGTRANLLAALIMILIYIFIIQKKIIWKFSIIMIFIVIISLYFKNINDYFSYMFISKVGSGVDKMEDLKEIFSVFRQYPLTILIGTGFGSESKYGIINLISEVSLFDMWRKSGFIGLIIFLYFIFKPINRLWNNKETRWIIYTYILYLIIAMTNPLFFSSTAYVMYIYIYTIYYQNKFNDIKEGNYN